MVLPATVPAFGPVAEVRLRPLPAPDVLEFDLPESHVFLLVDDGTTLVPTLARRLEALGWQVVVLRRASGVAEGVCALTVHTPDEAMGAVDVGCVLTHCAPEEVEAAVVAALDEVRDRFGPVAGCMVVAPCEAGTEDGLGAGEGVRLAFLLAKHLHDPLAHAAAKGWGGFFAVTRLDGALGFTGAMKNLQAVSGVTGLIKTLRLEWPTVACRAVDIAPELTTAAAAEAVVGEVLDPNRLISEVGWREGRRVTLIAEVGLRPEEKADGA